ncbi:MAG: hypothetical protein ABIR56_17000 [Polaromonas sp.]
MSRLTERLLRSSPRAPDEPEASVPAVVPKWRLGFPACIAEFLLVFRIRARRSKYSADLLERAVQVVLVTCKHWFGASDHPQRDSRGRY